MCDFKQDLAKNKKLKKKIPKMQLAKKIAEDLELGFKVFLNFNNKNILAIPDFDQLDENIEFWESEIKELTTNSQSWKEIPKWNSKEEFEFMQNFVENGVHDKNLQDELTAILQNAKPFRNFKFLIENNGIYRETWFEFIAQKHEKYIEKLLKRSCKNDCR